MIFINIKIGYILINTSASNMSLEYFQIYNIFKKSVDIKIYY